jgi:hypothetical protein
MMLCQAAATPIPTGEMIPSPVITTLRFDKMTPPNRKEMDKIKTGAYKMQVSYF